MNAVGGFSALIIGVLRSYDHRNYYKVEKWTKDGAKIERMLYAGSNLDKAQAIFAPPSSMAAHQAYHSAADAVLNQWLEKLS